MGPTQVVQTHWSQLNLFYKEILEKIPSEMEVALLHKEHLGIYRNI